MEPSLEERNLQFLNLVVRLIIGPVIYIWCFFSPRVSFLSFPHAAQKLPRCSLSPVPSPLPPDLKMFIIIINLSCRGGGWGKITQERSVLISYHLLSDKRLACQSIVRYSVFIVTRDIQPNSVLKANLEENLCLTFIYT